MMKRPLVVALVASLVLASCGWRDSRINPRNWFGGARPAPVEAEAEAPANPLIPRRRGVFARPERPDLSVPVAAVTELRIEATNSGAIIYASGVAARQGAYGVRLVPDNDDLLPDENGVLSFSFRALYPRDATPVGSEFSRTIHDAYSISRQNLEGVRVIRISAAQNALESRRR